MRMAAQDQDAIVKQCIAYVVDDDEEVRSSIAFMLETEGMRSQAFESAAELLDSLPRLSPGCLLIDLRMPEMDGLELMAELGRRGCDWPVVAMTGNDARDFPDRARAQGAVDFIAKPFDIDMLLVCLRMACRMVCC